MTAIHICENATGTKRRGGNLSARLLEGLNILLVEEEALIAMEIEQLCYDDGAARVFTINSHENPCSELPEVDAAILDARIGEEWNRDLGLHLMRKEIPFVFATGYDGSEPFFTAFPEIPIVGKPFVGRELVQALSAAIERTRSGDR